MTHADPLHNLGVRLSAGVGELRVWSQNAEAMDLCIFDATDPNWIVKTVPMTRDADNVWSGRSRTLSAGRHYGIRVSGPAASTNSFHPEKTMVEPYSRGLVRVGPEQWQSSVVDDAFDWAGSVKPKIALDHTVVYEAHVRGISKLNPAIPADLRGTYAGLAHESTITYLKELGVTSVELLPVQAFVSEQRLLKQGLTNYWGYNTFNFFTPHADYATMASQSAGPEAVLREFKGMVKLLHEAGLEVILDVVYNHTAEEGPGGPASSLRGIDNATYYRQNDAGGYIDVTGCGNTLNVSNEVPRRLVLDSLKYWANDVQIDGFRFDLAATLSRGDNVEFQRDHPLIKSIQSDPELAGVKLVAEPWDVGMGGWQTGNFPDGWTEWNDRYRDRMRSFWLTDIAAARDGHSGSGIGRFATRLAGSANTFSLERGPLASLNFITAHDGFTMADLTAYNVKHNVGNGESNRDGTDSNNSFNHGAEGPTRDRGILATRRKAMRNLLGTLLLSAGVPMLTAGDEFGRSQRGNNNAYCHDSELTWLNWDLDDWQIDLHRVTKKLLQLRRDNPALRPVWFGRSGETTLSASEMDWYNIEGKSMSEDNWHSPKERTLQYLAASTPEFEEFNRILLIVQGRERDVTVTLPEHAGVSSYSLLWDSSHDDLSDAVIEHIPGTRLLVPGASMQLFRAS
ncbi:MULTISPECIES: glycogen debranching protein GlgX [Cryobacterium]|uniref:Glycogen debranching protein GlgX n=1 Tax=Cryobacterium glucosi TaxID=1259175 RepID=A0ABY2ISC7_9MICO|nr:MULTISPECIES: glycogen debranching protein GlgX [Cryobacterium]MEB0285526.1 glycogen debranching protein GlgX [Cryobacterium sp. 10S3]MEB0304544.1 glycogen debranching protein GlgX [Cryobacterium sp. 10I1]TFB96486.1 glycogen debranching protein GlgX [Cryobacterium sp. MDB2-A-1]TFC11116.1 glycogen debranching protein GlgX [Cryobacterium sp. MDB2-33-2]TFC12771.1 glycogen debranching protein GlgX [Cryobacterium sp. MDB2-A-2]